MIEAAKATIQTSDAALKLYKQIVDQIGSTGYTKQTVTIIGDLKTSLMDGIDMYEKTPISIFDWCDTAIPLLTTYKDKKDAGDATQNEILIKALDNGEDIMTNAQNDLGKSSVRFNAAAGKLTAFENRMTNDFDEISMNTTVLLQSEASKKLVADLKANVALVREFFENFICTKDKISKEIREIGEFKVETEEAKTYVSIDEVPELEDTVIESVDNVISQCNLYHKKYE